VFEGVLEGVLGGTLVALKGKGKENCEKHIRKLQIKDHKRKLVQSPKNLLLA
jgi:hypothetical protein